MDKIEILKAEKYLNKELGFVKNTLISYEETVKAMAKYAKNQAINYTLSCTELRDEYLQPELDKYKNIKVGLTTGKSDM